MNGVRGTRNKENIYSCINLKKIRTVNNLP